MDEAPCSKTFGVRSLRTTPCAAMLMTAVATTQSANKDCQDLDDTEVENVRHVRGPVDNVCGRQRAVRCI